MRLPSFNGSSHEGRTITRQKWRSCICMHLRWFTCPHRGLQVREAPHHPCATQTTISYTFSCHPNIRPCMFAAGTLLLGTAPFQNQTLAVNSLQVRTQARHPGCAVHCASARQHAGHGTEATRERLMQQRLWHRRESTALPGTEVGTASNPFWISTLGPGRCRWCVSLGSGFLVFLCIFPSFPGSLPDLWQLSNSAFPFKWLGR